jgi:NAD(P)-dependent dehydrogenase (short-subunit alcohol dehydrogenase family)
MTRCALKNGDIAVTTLRTPSNLDALCAEYPSSDKLLIIKLDVTKSEQISSVFKEIKDKLGRIDYVFNNAGYAAVGEVEGVGEADAKAMFEVNFWGAMNVAKEALKFFREVNKPQGGYLLNVSSVVGLVAKPLLGWYTASKHGKHPLHVEVPCPSPNCPHRYAYSPRGGNGDPC